MLTFQEAEAVKVHKQFQTLRIHEIGEENKSIPWYLSHKVC